MAPPSDTSPIQCRSTPLAALPQPRTPDERSFVVLSDVHYPADPERAAETETSWAFKTVLADVRRLDPSMVVVLGDVTHAGRVDALTHVARRLKSLDWPVYGVPGNHDLVEGDPDRGVSIDEFADLMAPEPYPYTARTDDLSLVGACASNKQIDTALRDAVVRGLTDTHATGLAIHYPMKRTIECLRSAGIPRTLLVTPVADDGIADLLAETDRHPLVLSGHLHVPLVVRGETHTEITAPPLCTYPSGYLYIRTGPSGTTVEFVSAVGDATRQLQRGRRMRRSTIERCLVEFTDAQLTAPPARSHPASASSTASCFDR